MSESCVVYETQASSSRLLPLPKALGVPSSRIRHARRLALYILSSLCPRLNVDSMEMAELCLGVRVMGGNSFSPSLSLRLFFLKAPAVPRTIKRACVQHAFGLDR